MSNYIYVMVRKDLPNAQRVVQAGHALWELSQGVKLDVHPSVIILGLDNEEKLKKEALRVQSLGIKGVAFNKPMMNNSTTAVAFLASTEEDREVFKRYQLLTDRSFLSKSDQERESKKECRHTKTKLDYQETFAYEFTPVKVCKKCLVRVSTQLTEDEKVKLVKEFYQDVLESKISDQEVELKKNGFNI